MNFATEIIVAVAGLLVPGIEFLIRKLRRPRHSPLSYASRLNELTQKLVESTREVDGIFDELAYVARERQRRVEDMERQLHKLEQVEAERTERIHALRRVDEQTAKHILALIEPGERRSAKRDYVLFGAGIVVSALLSIVLAAIGVP